MTKEKIDRINELAKKAKTLGLSSQEKAEQQSLRKEYLESVKSNFKKELDNIIIVDEKGNRTPISALKK